jgi:hypothetical protein
MKTREIFLLLLIILVGLAISVYYSGRIHFLELNWPEFLVEGESFSFEETKRIEPPLPELLTVNNPRGEVIVNPGESENIEIYWEKQVWARNGDEARRKEEKINLQTEKKASELVVKPSQPEGEKIRYRSNLRIIAPASLALNIENSHGLVSLAGFKKARVHNAHGQVKVSHLAGELLINNRHGDISLDDIGGPVEIFNRHGEIVILKASEKVKIEASYGHLDIDEAAGGLEIKAEHLSVSGRRIKGPADISTSYEPVDLKEIGAARISNRYGLVRIDGARGELTIENRYSPIEIANLEGNLSLSGKNTRIRGQSIRGQVINIDTSYDNVELEDFEGETSIFIRHGNVSAQPASLKFKFNFEGSYSSLRFLWPAAEKASTEISVRSGKILWQLDEPVNQFESNGETILRAFWNDKTAPLIRIKTSYGQVAIAKADRQAQKKSYLSLAWWMR